MRLLVLHFNDLFRSSFIPSVLCSCHCIIRILCALSLKISYNRSESLNCTIKMIRTNSIATTEDAVIKLMSKVFIDFFATFEKCNKYDRNEVQMH